jgi:hypothetical protein
MILFASTNEATLKIKLLKKKSDWALSGKTHIHEPG